MNHAIIVAAGSGTRLNTHKSKAFVELLGKPLLFYAISIFEKCNRIDSIVLVVKKELIKETNDLITKYGFRKVANIVDGGKERQDSVYNGLKALKAKPEDLVVIHNSSNIFVKEEEVLACLAAAQETGAAVLGRKVKDTLKKDFLGYVEQTFSRENLWQVQTPQTIKYSLAMQAFEKARKDNFYGTDDVQLVERLGCKIKLVECDSENFKITTPSDLKLAEKILLSSENYSNYRVGIGLDSHRFSDEQKPLVLAGFQVPNHKGLEANSDGDVVLHALFNALSQSIGEKSIGNYCDGICKKGIKDSKEYIAYALKMLNAEGYRINNVGIMIEGKTPKIELLVDDFKKSLSILLQIEEKQIGITATSGEDLTEFGKGLGLQCFAIVSVVKK